MYNRIIVISMLSILVISCEKSYYDMAPQNPDKEKILLLVNEQRAKGCNCGDDYYPPVDPVIWNDTLELVAINHSKDMDKKNYFDHTNKDGKSPGDRLYDVGYQWSAYGENIGKGYTSEEEAITGWLNSPGHCRNIMREELEEMGVGTSGPYWTQLFATQK